MGKEKGGRGGIINSGWDYETKGRRDKGALHKGRKDLNFPGGGGVQMLLD